MKLPGIGSVDQATRLALLELSKRIDAASNPVGGIKAFAGSTAPAGWLLLDGSTRSRTGYAALFAVVGTTYGVGDGSTTFGLPDLRGRALIGVGTGTGLSARTLGAIVGAETHTLAAAESGLVGHNHTQNAHRHQVPYKDSGAAGALRYMMNASTVGVKDYGQMDLETAVNQAVASAAALSAHNNMQPSLALNFIIKF